MQLPTPLDCISKRRALAAEPCTCRQRYPLLLRGQHHITDFIVGAAPVDQTRVTGIRHIADLANAGMFEYFEKLVRPLRVSRVHLPSTSPSAGRSPSSSSSSFVGIA